MALRILRGLLGVILGLALWLLTHQLVVFLLELALQIPVLCTLKFYQVTLLWLIAALPSFVSVELGGRMAHKIGETARIFAWVVLLLFGLEVVLTLLEGGISALWHAGLLRLTIVKWFVEFGTVTELLVEFKYE